MSVKEYTLTSDYRDRVESYMPYVQSVIHNWCAKHGYDHYDDMLANGYLKMCEAVAKYDGREYGLHKLVQMRVNGSVIDYWRAMYKGGYNTWYPFDVENTTIEPTQLSKVADQQEIMNILHIVERRLTKRQKQIFDRIVLQDLDIATVCKRLRITDVTLHTHLNLARKRIRKLMNIHI